jgi:hypothetical protein
MIIYKRREEAKQRRRERRAERRAQRQAKREVLLITTDRHCNTSIISTIITVLSESESKI